MRKLIVTNIVSLDGYHVGPGGDVMVLPMDHSFDAYNAERLATADTLLLGRISYEMFKGFWPGMIDNPDATPDHKAISRLENAIEKIVVSDSITRIKPNRGAIPRGSSAGRRRTSRSPRSNVRTAETSSSSAAEPSGTISWPRAWSTNSI